MRLLEAYEDFVREAQKELSTAESRLERVRAGYSCIPGCKVPGTEVLRKMLSKLKHDYSDALETARRQWMDMEVPNVPLFDDPLATARHELMSRVRKHEEELAEVRRREERRKK